MRRLNFLFYLCFYLLSCSITFAATASTVETSFGTITLPTEEEINAEISRINDSSQSADDKTLQLNALNSANKIIDKYYQITEQSAEFAQNQKNAARTLDQLENELYTANQQYKADPPDLQQLDLKAVEQLIDELNQEQQSTQHALSEANADFIAIQTLPNRAQTTIAANNSRISTLISELSATTPLTDALDYRLKALELYVCQQENALLQNELNAQNTLQDIANYKIRINTLKNDYLTAQLRAAQALQNKLIAKNLVTTDSSANTQDLSPELAKQLETNQTIAGYIDKQLQDNARMEQELHDVETALNSVRQIRKTLNDQVTGVNGNLMLSRLLNRQQSEIPTVKVSFNLDELIPNLNLWLYDLRNYRNELFDTESYVKSLISKTPALAEHQKELEDLVRHRRSLFDKLNQSMTTALNQAINLKLKNTELQQITAEVNSTINDHLFWLTSNLPLGKDFIFAFIPTLKMQLNTVLTQFNSNNFYKNALQALVTLLLPLLTIALLARVGRDFLIKNDNLLAQRLDKPNDAYYVTPLALLIRFALSIPKIALISAGGSIIIYFAVNSLSDQMQVMRMLILHVAVFIFFLDILKPNSLFQRHYAFAPREIERQRTLLDKIWLAIVPILIVANIRELNPTAINNDMIGYCIMLLCCLYLTYIAVRSLKEEFTEREMSIGSWLSGLLIIVIPLTLLIMLALGYYYTVVKLVNRIAFSIYICLAYIIVSNTVRRTLFVAENRMLRKARENFMQNKLAIVDKGNHKVSLPSNLQKEQRRKKLDSLRLELINTKAFKLINVFLLCGTAIVLYLQWNDLAGVLNYLDTVYLWKDESFVNGVMVLNKALTLADILIALLVLVITVVLNRNLPALMERLFMLRPNPRFKSTSYTVRILSSYVIIALGVIFAAGALGISWDNLQWLVAALSVGLGFGLQEIFANFVSGIIILFERQIRVGDIVTLNGLSGTVNKIRIRATTIISFDNKEVMIPNREFITSALTNWSLSNTVTMLEFAIGVAYGTDMIKAKAILHDIVRSCRYLTPEKPYKIYIKSLDASCVTIMCEVYVNEIGNRKPTYDYLSSETLRRFAVAGIEIPFNKLDVTIMNLQNGEKLSVPAQQG